ncbi:MAG: family 43 glycosylhydrolase [Lachnospira sp.]|nr:family 43 glycosylhydrolase [Lachnospira sp.]
MIESIKDAIYLEKLDSVKRILENEPSLIDEKDENGVLMALLAAKTGNLELVRYIVEYSRAHMNIHDNFHRGMLHYAAMSGNVKTCRYLVERVGLSPLEGDNNLITPYEIAHDNRFIELEEYFKEVVGAPLDKMYHNPIRTGMYPDPSIVRVGNDYYMVNSSFIYYPCIPVSHSTDLVHWKIIGYAITNPEWAGVNELEGGRGYWAPDISYYKGRFYITATYRLNDDGNVYRKQIVVSSENPEGPYSKPAIIDEDGIDPSIFNDDDGRRYMLLNRGARIFELNEDATRQISEATLLYYGDNKRASEGPHLLKKDGYYYLFEAEGGTGAGHRITVSRSKELKGIYEPCPYNPIMRQNDEDAIIQRCGHGKPVQTQNGQWYMVYLCGRKIVGKNGEPCSILGRETALDPITWTADGWPIVNNLDGPSALQIKPDLPEYECEDGYEDDFNESYLSSDWTFPRVPEMDGIVLSNSYVKVKGSKEDLDSMYARNILLRRQQHFRFSVESKMKMPELYPGQNAGLTCYYDENTYLKFGIFATDEEKPRLVIKVVERIGDKVIEHEETELDYRQKYIYLRIETNYLRRTFKFSYDNKEYIKSAALDNVYYLCDEGLKKGKRFTGAMVGMYAYAGEHGSRYTDEYGRHGSDIMYAEFDYFNYIK